MLVSAAVCPHPPLLIPEIASGAAAELTDLRASCDDAIQELLSPAPELVIVVGGDVRTRSHDSNAAGSLAPYGVDQTVGDGVVTLPLSLMIGRWLLDEGCSSRLRFEGVAEDAPGGECRQLGARLAASAARVALLCMGDGFVYPTEQRPERLGSFDESVARALASGQPAVLAETAATAPPGSQIAGRAPWQVLAAAAGRDPAEARLLAAEAPYGVGYFVASWQW